MKKFINTALNKAINKKTLATTLATTLALSSVPAIYAFASPTMSMSHYIIGPQMMLAGEVEIPYTELHLTVDNIYYMSSTTNYNHEFTVRIEGATFDKASDKYTVEDFEKLIYINGIQDNVSVEVTRFRDDEFTFSIKDGLLRSGDKIAIALNSELNSRKSNATASVAVYSDFYTLEPTSYTSVAERAFYASVDKTVNIVAGETVKLDGKGIKISPVVKNSYLGGTTFELGLSKGFEFVDSGEIKAVSSGNAITYGEVKNGKVYIDSPNASEFSIYGLKIKADSDLGNISSAEIDVYAQGMLATVSTNSTTTTEASEGSAPADKVPTTATPETETPEVDTTTPDTTTTPEDTDDDFVFDTLIEIPVGRKFILVDGKTIEIDVPAYIHQSGYTMLPIRAVADALGDTATVDWDNDTSTAIINIGDAREILMTVGSSFYVLNGDAVPIIGVPMEIIDGRSFLPVRPLANALGIIDIDWNNDTQVVTLNGNIAK